MSSIEAEKDHISRTAKAAILAAFAIDANLLRRKVCLRYSHNGKNGTEDLLDGHGSRI